MRKIECVLCGVEIEWPKPPERGNTDFSETVRDHLKKFHTEIPEEKVAAVQAIRLGMNEDCWRTGGSSDRLLVARFCSCIFPHRCEYLQLPPDSPLAQPGFRYQRQAAKSA